MNKLLRHSNKPVSSALNVAKFLVSQRTFTINRLMEVLIWLNVQYYIRYSQQLFTDKLVVDNSQLIYQEVVWYFAGFGNMPIFIPFKFFDFNISKQEQRRINHLLNYFLEIKKI